MAAASESIWDAIVVGGGISGLTAALEIARCGHRVLVLESRGRLGGRIHTVHDSGQSEEHQGRPVDLGASFVHGTEGNPLVALGTEAGYTLHLPPPESTAAIYEADGRPWAAEDAERLMYHSHATTFSRLESLAQDGAAPPPTASVGAALREASAGQPPWTGIGSEERKQILEMSEMWNGWTGAELDKVSLKWWGFQREFQGPDALVKEGYGTLVQWVAGELRGLGARILLNSSVTRFETRDDQSAITVQADGLEGIRKHSGRFVISSLPLGILQQIPSGLTFSPSLPERKTAALNRLGSGLLNKVMLSYDTAWWRGHHEDQQSSDGWISILPPPSSSLQGSGSIGTLFSAPLLFQDYTHLTGAPVLLLFLGPPRAEAVEVLQEDEVGRMLHERLLTALGPSKNSESTNVSIALPRCTITRWRADPHSRGSYSYIPAAHDGESEPPSPLDMVEAGRPVWGGKLRFCGEHTHEHCYASVHGALLSGQREGKEVSVLLQKPDE